MAWKSRGLAAARKEDSMMCKHYTDTDFKFNQGEIDEECEDQITLFDEISLQMKEYINYDVGDTFFQTVVQLGPGHFAELTQRRMDTTPKLGHIAETGHIAEISYWTYRRKWTQRRKAKADATWIGNRAWIGIPMDTTPKLDISTEM
ncbi:hypothetical protein FQR65_LT11978 [Abscondita terminalis]|nr:hypothetical protein FQR65_LT11978 [Abscondita terminalis]